MEDYLISAGVAILLSAIKNPAKKAQLRKVCLKIFNTMKIAFAGDPDFS